MASLGVAGGSSCSSIRDRKLTFSLYRVTSAAGSSSSLCKASVTMGSKIRGEFQLSNSLRVPFLERVTLIGEGVQGICDGHQDSVE